MYQEITSTVAANSYWGAGNRFKNGASLKSQTSRVNFSIIFLVAAIAVSAVLSSCTNTQTHGSGNTRVERWEYKIVGGTSTYEQDESILNQFGAEGWELVSTQNKYFFKRRLP